MKKMKTLFKRSYIGEHEFILTDVVTPGCEWVLAGEGIPTVKIDGTCCLVKDGKLFARFETWKGHEDKTKKFSARHKARKIPEGSILCQSEPDEITGSFPVWVPVENDKNNTYKWYRLAFEKQTSKEKLEDGTYELIGPHFQSNPYKLDEDKFIKHGSEVLENVPRDFNGLRECLENNYIEGIVFHRGNGEMCKIKRTDFNFEWNGSTQKRN